MLRLVVRANGRRDKAPVLLAIRESSTRLPTVTLHGRFLRRALAAEIVVMARPNNLQNIAAVASNSSGRMGAK